MKKTSLVFVLWIALLSVQHLDAQPDYGKNFIGAKVLFLEYGRANGIDSLSITNGLEAFYQRNFNKYLSLSLPAKFGVINVAEDINNRRFMSGDVLLHLQYYEPEARFWPYVFAGGGIVWEEFEETNTQIPLGGGLNIRIGKNSYVNLQGEYRISTSDDRNNFQAGLGFMYRLGKAEPDTDGDGVADSADACPTDPGSPELMGCPDTDGDGVVDRQDACPETAGIAALNGCPDADGDGIRDADDQCPEIAGLEELNGCPDTDADGIADRFDDCPEEPGPVSNQGCPIGDTDGDGIPDDVDECPNQPGSEAARGCPDRDGDGFTDDVDRCPDVAGTFNGCPDTDGDGLVDPDDRCPNEAGPTDNRGCPEIEAEVQEVLDFAMQAVQFETGKSTLKQESFEVLDRIAEIMEQYQAYKLRISGHTDSVGNEDTNKILSEERAKACYQYLVSQGVSPSRLSYEGFGESQPIADNDTRQGRRLNRRVQFELYLE